MTGDFRFSYLLIKYRKVSGSDDTRNAVVRKLAQGFESLSLRHKRTVRTLTIKSLGAYISFLTNISGLLSKDEYTRNTLPGE